MEKVNKNNILFIFFVIIIIIIMISFNTKKIDCYIDNVHRKCVIPENLYNLKLSCKNKKTNESFIFDGSKIYKLEIKTVFFKSKKCFLFLDEKNKEKTFCEGDDKTFLACE